MEAPTGSVIAGKTISSMPEHLECEVLQNEHYISPLTFTLGRHNSMILSCDCLRCRIGVDSFSITGVTI